MSEEIEATVWRAFHESAVVQAIERAARRVGAAIDASSAANFARSSRVKVRGRAGYVIVTAVATHVSLMVASGRMMAWQAMILPGIALAAGALLIAGSRSQADR